ncbi:Protein kinase, AMP-activated, gamma 1 non-catalytic subunit [Cyanidiococcus yangmingshanensis]|uniref:Protein kinase, AMP-activated, gamma 1 non-catalytic subunit n=1 Tax=Cyanidiococcus yangmingshanensis TaxID=2690220 RepID=A0A7J7IS96_9RHOD|nr:Protein kinase, AMP-activated, gamma 1 non-catalytic subunit [Cyanidiococcus yangmingshanensis]
MPKTSENLPANQSHTKHRRVSRDDRVQVGDSIQSQVEQARVAITRFMKERRVEDVAPLCSRVVVLDVRLSLPDAFAALLEQQSSVAVLWDTVKHCLVGLLTAADVAEILLFLRESLMREATPTANDNDLHESSSPPEADDADYNRRALRFLSRQTLGSWLQMCLSHHDQLVPPQGSRAGVDAVSATATYGQVSTPAAALQMPDECPPEGNATTRANSRAPRPSALQLIACRANGSLYEAAILLRDHSIHHVPLVIGSDRTVLCILTHARLLAYVNEQFGVYRMEKQWHQQQQQQRERQARSRTDTAGGPHDSRLSSTDLVMGLHSSEMEELSIVVDLFSIPIETLGIGTFCNIAQVHHKEPLWQAISKLVDYNVHAIPVVDDSGALVDSYSRADTLWLIAPEVDAAMESFPTSPWGRAPETKPVASGPLGTGPRSGSDGGRYHMLRDHVLVEDHFRMLQRQGRRRRPPATCSPKDTLRTVFERLGHDFRIHQIFVVDENRRVIGVISLSDILDFFMDRSASLPSSPDLRYRDVPIPHIGADFLSRSLF